MKLYENSELAIMRPDHRHPGIDSAIDLAAQSGDVIVGHVERKNAANGADIFGGAPLSIVGVLPDGSVAILYTFGWRWSESGQRNVLGWWFGASEWDVAAIQQYGPVLA